MSELGVGGRKAIRAVSRAAQSRDRRDGLQFLSHRANSCATEPVPDALDMAETATGSRACPDLW